MYLKLFGEKEGNGEKVLGNKPQPARPCLNSRDWGGVGVFFPVEGGLGIWVFYVFYFLIERGSIVIFHSPLGGHLP